MSRRKLLLVVLPLALLGAVAYVRLATHDAPAGQPPLAYLDLSSLAALKAAFHARHNGVTGLSRVTIDHLVANYYHTEEAKEMGRSFNAKQPPDPDKFYR